MAKTLEEIAADINASIDDALAPPALAEALAGFGESHGQALRDIRMLACSMVADLVEQTGTRELAMRAGASELLYSAAFLVRSLKWKAGEPFSPARFALAAYMAAEHAAAIPGLDPPADDEGDDTPLCIGCGKRFRPGDAYYPDESGGEVHAACIGSECEAFTKNGEPLALGDEIPAPLIWAALTKTGEAA